jgi:hypothetical protein
MGRTDKSHGIAGFKMRPHIFEKDFVPMVDDGRMTAGKSQSLGS